MDTEQGEIPVQRIVSGGQTGVDRAALEVALRLGIEHGGWCPRGRLAEDGVIPACFHLTETSASEYWVRTERNVLDSEGTLILYRAPMRGGTELTYWLARKHCKPCLALDLSRRKDTGSAGWDVLLSMARQWIDREAIRVLNIAGPRESSAPGIAAQARDFLQRLLGGWGVRS